MATLFVDEKAHPAAIPYYKIFVLEPTKTGKPISIKAFVEMKKNNEWSLPKLLEKIIEKCQNDKDILIVSHGAEMGLYLPLRLNTRNFVTKDHLEQLIYFEKFLDKNLKAKQISFKTFIKEMGEVLKKEPNKAKKNIKDKQKKEALIKKYKDTLKKSGEIAQRCKIYKKELVELIDLRKKVLKLNLQQIEIRACNVGKNNATLYSFMTFFGAQSIGAPDIFSAFGYIESGPYAKRHSKIWNNYLKRHPGGRDNFGLKSGMIYLARSGRKQKSMSCIAESKLVLQAWINKCFPHTSAKINLRRFPRCHLNTMRKGGTFIFPKEYSYLSHINVCKKGAENPKKVGTGNPVDSLF